MPELDDDLVLIRDAAREAGEIAMRYFRQEPDVWMKAGESPVSEADMAVDHFLKRVLLEARPEYGWLSEETADAPDRLTRHRTFVVDPIDGTRAFLEGRDVWCVSVAVVEHGRTTAGVLDCPVRKEVFEAASGSGATCNGHRVAVRDPEFPVLVAGPKAMINAIPQADLKKVKRIGYVPSLAYRLAKVARGEIDATFIRANAHDWDLAAADLILQEAGGTIVDGTGARPFFAGNDPRLGNLVAGSGYILDTMAKVIEPSDPLQRDDAVP